MPDDVDSDAAFIHLAPSLERQPQQEVQFHRGAILKTCWFYIKYELGELAEGDQKSRTTIERYLQILNNRRLAAQDQVLAAMMTPSKAVN